MGVGLPRETAHEIGTERRGVARIGAKANGASMCRGLTTAVWIARMTTGRLDPTLYLIADAGVCGPSAMPGIVAAAAANGTTMVQLRDKEGSTGRLVDTARELREVLAGTGVPLLINDRVDVALAGDANGVHLGQSDMTPEDARALLGLDALIGLTVRSREEAARMPHGVVDYVSIGGIFPTATKNVRERPIGLEGLARLAAILEGPVVAISGIDETNAAEVIAAGVDGIAVSSAICAAEDPGAVSARLAAIVARARQERVSQ